MSAYEAQKYYHDSIHIPYHSPEEGEEEWTENPDTLHRGMLLINSFQYAKVNCLESRATGEILFNKVISYNREFEPRELRVSTAPVAAWLVAERLALALRFFHLGIPPGGDRPPLYWRRIVHRDLHIGNIFLHYHPRRKGRRPRAGIEFNAFPEPVISDFGEAIFERDEENPDEWFAPYTNMSSLERFHPLSALV
ncbi:hypothetical protein F5Y11DRAFT_367262 [Daldinia sp. FL1419]|nr:hypothetical protein F5Y11DRAFT_367262 [Daldinia sp. FL1419]